MHSAAALVDPGFHFVWLICSAAFLLPWLALFATRPHLRRRMVWASVLTTPFGLTEPLFVPAYRNPPSLFDLALRTGFDIESLIFCFAIGGLAAASYRSLAPPSDRRRGAAGSHETKHRFHALALASPLFVIVVLLRAPCNPIYAGIAALLTGAATTLPLAVLLIEPSPWRRKILAAIAIAGALVAAYLLDFLVRMPLVAQAPGGRESFSRPRADCIDCTTRIRR